jgi:hypothetical protein
MSRFALCHECGKVCKPTKSGVCKSCMATIRIELAKKANKKESLMINEPLFQIWLNLRFVNKHHRKPKCYSGWHDQRIAFDFRWKNNFFRFQRWMLNNGYIPGKTRLKRINPKHGFKPNNLLIVPKKGETVVLPERYNPFIKYPYLKTKHHAKFY